MNLVEELEVILAELKEVGHEIVQLIRRIDCVDRVLTAMEKALVIEKCGSRAEFDFDRARIYGIAFPFESAVIH